MAGSAAAAARVTRHAGQGSGRPAPPAGAGRHAGQGSGRPATPAGRDAGGVQHQRGQEAAVRDAVGRCCAVSACAAPFGPADGGPSGNASRATRHASRVTPGRVSARPRRRQAGMPGKWSTSGAKRLPCVTPSALLCRAGLYSPVRAGGGRALGQRATRPAPGVTRCRVPAGPRRRQAGMPGERSTSGAIGCRACRRALLFHAGLYSPVRAGGRRALGQRVTRHAPGVTRCRVSAGPRRRRAGMPGKWSTSGAKRLPCVTPSGAAVPCWPVQPRSALLPRCLCCPERPRISPDRRRSCDRGIRPKRAKILSLYGALCAPSSTS